MPQTGAGLRRVQGVGVEQPPGAALVAGHRADDVADRTLKLILFAVAAIDPLRCAASNGNNLLTT
ncbi:MAG: hypothetical protein R3F37_16105 [Candidatus Competibacteraceae bacterium]